MRKPDETAVRAMIAKLVPCDSVDELVLDNTLRANGLDSLDTVDLELELEDKFDINFEIGDNHLEFNDTVLDVERKVWAQIIRQRGKKL